MVSHLKYILNYSMFLKQNKTKQKKYNITYSIHISIVFSNSESYLHCYFLNHQIVNR